MTRVGGRYGDGEPAVLIVRVSAPAVNGRANGALVEAMAEAFGVNRPGVVLVSGASSRRKVIEVGGADPGDLERLLRA